MAGKLRWYVHSLLLVHDEISKEIESKHLRTGSFSVSCYWLSDWRDINPPDSQSFKSELELYH